MRALILIGLITVVQLGIFSFFFAPGSQDGFLKKQQQDTLFTDEIIDNSTYANLRDVQTKHIHLNLTLDFNKKLVYGNATLSMKVLNESFSEVILDSSFLDIHNVLLQTEKGFTPLDFFFTQENPNIGEALHIKVNKQMISGNNITINYSTTNNSTALSWFEPKQTFGKTLPYVYTQWEEIYWRSLLPHQDTPAIKVTYSGLIQSPWNITVRMSANTTHEERVGDLRYTRFRNDIPIPSYLITIVAGNLVTKQVGPRTNIITEPEFMDQALVDLHDIENVLTEAEKFLPRYDWGDFNLIVPPASFPVGGMENPLLTIISPAIITGDKSQFDVVIHELSHSWSGNLITNRNWENFWLNEGIDVFLERHLIRRIYGEREYKLQAFVGNSSLFRDMEDFGFNSTFTTLHPNLEGANPADSYSIVPYEKGFQFMTYLESLVGQANMEKFLFKYFDKFRYKSLIHTEFWETFQEFLNVTFSKEKVDEINSKVDYNQWIFGPGKIPVTLDFYAPEIDESRNLAKEYIKLGGGSSPAGYEKFKKYSSKLKNIFLDMLSDNISDVNNTIIRKLDEDYDLSHSTDPDVKTSWFDICIRRQYGPALPLANKFILSTGGFEYLPTLYKAYNDTDRQTGIYLYMSGSYLYHPMVKEKIKKVLNYE